MVRCLCALTLASLIIAGDARAEPAEIEARRHLVVSEAFGKLGLYGLGYEYSVRDWLTVGGAAAMWRASTRTVLASSAYVGSAVPITVSHRLFAQAGPELIRESEPAVPGFDGLAKVSLGGQITGGYEYRRDRWLVRSHAVITAGKGGVALWGGLSFGVRL